MKDGRLDEACRIVSAPDVQAHRSGQALITRLVKALVDRGQAHLEARRYPQAAADCEQAARLGGNTTEVATLRQNIAEHVQGERHSTERRDARLAQARRHIDNGELSLGGQTLDDLPEDLSRVGQLQQKADAQRAAAQKAIDRARGALDSGDVHTAMEALRQARGFHQSNDELDAMITHVHREASSRVRTYLVSGRPDQAQPLLSAWRRLAPEHPDVLEYGNMLGQLHRARTLIDAGQVNAWPEARTILQRLAHACPEAVWIRDVIASLDACIASASQAQSSPLGLLDRRDEEMTLPMSPPAVPHFVPSPQREAVPMAAGAKDSIRELPSRFMLHVDGAGSFLVLCGDRVTIGPGGSTGRCDVSLLADGSLPTGTLERHDDDYFLRSDGSVKVNGKPTERTLLAHGDRVSLSSRSGFKFLRPNAASATAMLQLSGTRLSASDTRKVILLKREIVIGSGPSAHVRLDGLKKNIVLAIQDNVLTCPSAESVLCEGKPMDRRAALPFDKHLQVGEVTWIARPVEKTV